MNKISFFTLLAVLAIFIWVRDLSWATTSDDTLPLLVSIPLFIWLGMPWKFKKEESPPIKGWLIGGTLLFLIGIGLNSTFLLAVGWTSLLWSWLESNSLRPKSETLKLMILPIMAFPWVALDASRLAWWFRLTGASTVAALFKFLGCDVSQMGTESPSTPFPFP